MTRGMARNQSRSVRGVPFSQFPGYGTLLALDALVRPFPGEATSMAQDPILSPQQVASLDESQRAPLRALGYSVLLAGDSAETKPEKLSSEAQESLALPPDPLRITGRPR